MRQLIVEFFGTALLAFVIFSTNNWLAIGAALAIGVLLGGAISGGAFNPAIVLAMYAKGALPKKDVIPYIVAEIIGAFAALHLYRKVA